MDKFPTSRQEPVSRLEDRLVDEPDRKLSTSTASQRARHHDQQRLGRHSPPTSGESHLFTKAQGKQPSYAIPGDFQRLGEVAAPTPAGPDTSSGLEDARRDPGSPNLDYRSRKKQNFLRRRSGGQPRGEGLTEVAMPPLISTSDSSTASSMQALDRGKFKDPENEGVDDDGFAAPTPHIARRPEEYIARRPPTPPVPRWLTELYTVSYLIFFAFLGTLARLGVQWLTFYPGTPIVTPVIWANFAGSFFLGFLIEDQGLFSDSWVDSPLADEKRTDDGGLDAKVKAERLKLKKAIPLYIGLATGFCGSFTSFSSFARDAFLAISNNLPTPINHPSAFTGSTPSTTSAITRNGGYSFQAWAAVVISTLALSIGGFIAGAQVAYFLEPATPRIPRELVRRLLDPVMVFVSWGCWLGTVFLAIWPPDRPSGPSSLGSWSNETWRGEVLFALVFAPAGCLLRFYISLKLNKISPSFPLGTFAVNMLGTAIEGMCYDIQHVGVGLMGMAGGGRVGCQALQGVMDGFCGCLTTVSTWVGEIEGMRRRHGYVYAFTSVVGALCLMLAIMGPIRWTVGFSVAACNTGYPNKLYG